MAQWSNVTPITFVQVFGDASADIVISWTFGDRGNGTPFDGPGGFNAWARWTGDLQHPTVTIRFDEAEDWNEAFLYQLALHELGHALGLDHNDQFGQGPLAVMNEFMKVDHLQPDDLSAIHSLYGWRQPKWHLLDAYPATVSIHSAFSGIGVTRISDGLYQLHSSGRIFHYTGGWFRMEDDSNAVQISASSGSVYQRRSDGSVLRYTGSQSSASWQLICDPGTASDIVAAGNNLFAIRRRSGPFTLQGYREVWRYTGIPITGWIQIGNGIYPSLAGSTNGQLYLLSGSDLVFGPKQISLYDTSTVPATWKTLDSNAAISAIAAGGDNLYKLHDHGSVYSYNGVTTTWIQIDNYPAIVAIFAAGNYFYLRHNTGHIWRYTGVPYQWERLDGNAHTVTVIGDDNGSVWQFQRDGNNRAIYRLNS